MTRIIKICIPIIILLCIMLNSIPAYAEIITVEADGYALLGSGDSLDVGYERAKHDAMRNAADKAGVYVSSYVIVENGMLTKDEIAIITANVMKVIEIDNTPEVIAGKGIQLKSHIKATINTDDMEMAAYKRNALIEKEQELQKIKEELANFKQEASKNKLSSLDEKYMIAMLEQVIITNNADKIIQSAETVLKLFPDNETARVALLYFHKDEIDYIINYMKKYPDDICGKCAYLQLINAPRKEYAKLVDEVKSVYSEEEFYNIIKPYVLSGITDGSVILSINAVFSKYTFINDIFSMYYGINVLIANEAKDSEAVYLLPLYDGNSAHAERILKEYAQKYPPDYFLTNK